MYAYGSAGSSDAHVRAQFAHATKAVAFGVGLLKFRAGERSSIRAAKLLEILRVVDDMQPQLRVLAAAPASGAASACILQALQFQQDALAEMIRVARSLGWESDARMIETAVAGTFPGEPPAAAPRYAGQEAAPRQNEGVPGIHLLRETAPAPAAPAHEGASAPSSELATVVAALTALTGQLAASMRAMEANRVVPYPMLPAYAPAVVAPPPNWTPPRPAPAAIADDDPGDDEDEHPRRARRAGSARRSGGLTTTRLAGSGVVIGFLALLGGISLANRMLVETSVASANASATPETGKPFGGRLSDYVIPEEAAHGVPPPPTYAQQQQQQAVRPAPPLPPGTAVAPRPEASHTQQAAPRLQPALESARLSPPPQPAADLDLGPLATGSLRAPSRDAIVAVLPPEPAAPKKVAQPVKPPKPSHDPELDVAPRKAAVEKANPAPSVAPKMAAANAAAEPDVSASASAAAAAEKGGAGRFVAVLSTHKDKQAATEASGQLKGQFASAMGGRQPEIQAASVGQQGTWYRLVLAAGSRDEAAEICGKLRSAGYSRCWVKSE